MDVCHHENVTECLLRAMLVKMDQTAATFDWNPLNFAFTAAIGVLALVIAGITIFQGLLAAGPGRVKSSKAVIGGWSKFTIRRFDWDEYAIRSTAFVPYIGWSGLSGLCIHDSEDEMLQTLLSRENILPHLDRDFDSKASWLLLLSTLGLENPEALGSSQLVGRSTDYLPADIQAAPAAAEVRCLVLMAAIADNGVVVDTKTRFPNAIGNSSQLTFREHPILGVVAAYEKFTAGPETAGETSHWRGAKLTHEDIQDNTLEKAKTKLAMFRSLVCLASGTLSYNGKIVWGPDKNFFYWYSSKGDNELLMDLRSRNKNCGHHFCEKALEKIRLSLITPLIATCFALLCATAPCDYRAFPAAAFGVSASITKLLKLQKKSDMNVIGVQRFMRYAAKALGVKGDTRAENILSSWIKPSASQFQDVNLLLRTRDAVHDTKEVGDCLDIFGSASLSLDSWIRKSSDLWGPESALRCLYNIDAWLFKEGGSEIACAMLHLLNDLFISEIGRTEADILAACVPLTQSPVPEEGPSARIDIFVDNTVLEGLRWFLIYRALLYAQILDGCNDTSSLFAKDFKDSVVKVL